MTQEAHRARDVKGLQEIRQSLAKTVKAILRPALSLTIALISKHIP